MPRSLLQARCFLAAILLFVPLSLAFADETFDKLIDSKNYSEAITYAEKKIPTTARDAAMWVKLGVANLETGLIEKALACYLVASRTDPKNYTALFGIAKVYNSLNQPANAAAAAKKALDVNFTPEASWEYARACIALNKPVDAKKALEKVVETDSTNLPARKELGIIFLNEKSYAKALDLLRAVYAKQPDGVLALKMGDAYRETNNPDSAIAYLKLAKDKKPVSAEASLALAKLYTAGQNYGEAATEYENASTKLQFSAQDYYQWAIAVQKSSQAPEKIAKAYQLFLDKVGTSTSKEALEAHREVGTFLYDKNNFQGALPHFQTIFGVDSMGKLVPNINFLLAACYQGAGVPKKAIYLFERELVLNPSNVETYARLGELYGKTGYPEKAKLVYEKMLSLNPNNPAIQMSLGEYNLKSKKYQDALKNFQKSYTLDRSAKAAEGMAMAAFALNQPDMARDAAESALHLDGALWEPRVVLSSIYMKDKNYKEAKDQLEFMVRKQPGTKEYWLKLATCYEQLNDPQRLSDIDRKIISFEPRNVQSHQRLARYALSQNDLKAAFDQFKELSVLTPRDPEVFKNLYEISLKTGNAAEAAQHLKQYVSLRPGDAAAEKDLGDMLYDKKDMAGALAAYRAAVKADPGIKGVYKRLAELLAAGDQLELAAALNGAIATQEADASTYATLGMSYAKLGQCPKAIDMLSKSVQLDPRNTAVLSMLAFCQAKTGNGKEAVISYEQAVAMNDKAVDELKALGDLYVSQNKTGQAVAMYKRYLAKKPGDHRIARTVADYEYSQKNYDEAIKYFAMITGPEAKNADVLFKYGQSCYSVKDTRKAKDIFVELAVLTPKNAEVFRILFDIASKDSSMKGDAALYLHKYVALKPSDADAQKNLGDMFYDAKNYAGAFAAYRAALTADPTLKGFYKRYVELVMTMGTPEELVKAMTAAVAAGEADAAMYASLGSVYQKQGNCAKAIDMYNRSLAIDPKNITVISSLAACQAKTGNLNEAVISYEQSIAMNDKAVDELKALGDLYMQQKKTGQAVAVYKRYCAKKPGDFRIIRTIADYEFNQNNFDEAIKYYAMITGPEAKNPDMLFKYGQACYSVKDYRKARDIFVLVAVLTPKNAEVFKILFDIASKDSTMKNDAALYLQKYAALKPADAASQKNLGDMFYESKNYAGALAAYRAALAADPSLKGFYKRYVELILMTKGSPEELVKAMTAAVAAGEADATMYASLGSVYQKQGNCAKAIDMYNKSLQFDPKNIAILSSVAQCQAKTGNVNDAVITYEQAVAMNDKAVDEYKALGELYTKQNKMGQAITMYKKYLEKKPSDYSVAKAVGDYSYNRKEYSEATRYYAMVGGAEAKKADFLWRYGQACYFDKNYKKASDVLNQLALLTPQNADIFKLLYDIVMQNNGSKNEAAVYLKKYVSAKPSDAAAQKNLGDLYYDQKNFDGALAAYRAALSADPAIKGFYKRYVEIVTMKGVAEEITKALKGAIAAGEADAQMYESMGAIEQKIGACPKAIDYYQKSLALDPKNVHLLSEMARCQAKTGNVNEAVISYEQAVAMNSSAVEEYKILGDLYMQQNKPSQAMAMYKKYLEKKPSSYKVAMAVGDYSFNQKNYDEAVKYFAMVGGAEAKSADFLFKYAQACYLAKNNKKASEVLLQLAKLTPANPEIYRMLYDIASKEGGNKKDAAAYLKKFLALKPNDATAQKNLGDMLYEEKNSDGALAAYKAALAADPAVKGFYKRYVELVTAKGVIDETIKALKGAIAAGEADAPMYYALGSVYQKSANYPKAIEMYQKVLTLDPRNTDALSVLAYCQAKAGNLKEATISYEQVVAMNPQDIKEYKALADLYVRQNKNDQAMTMYKKCLEKNPSDYKTAMAVGDYEFKNKNYDEAVRYLAMVQGAEAKNTSYLLLYAQACYKSKTCSKSADIFKDLAILTPKNPDVFKTLYDISVKAGNKQEATVYLKKYVALKPADAASQRDLGDLLYEQKDAAGALEAYRSALKADPSIKGFYKRYVELVMTKGGPDETAKALAGAVAAGEADAAMYSALGAIYQKQGSFAKAIAMYQKALAIDPRNVPVLSSLASCQAKNGDVNDAVISYEQTIAMNSDAITEYKVLGDLYSKQNKSSQALAMYRKYLEKKPGDNSVARAVGDAAFGAKNYDEAMKYLAMVQGEKARDIDYYSVYGQSSYYSKDYKKGIELFERFREINAKATQKHPSTTTVMKLLGDAYDKSGNQAKALEIYSIYTRLGGVKDAEASFRKAQLTEISNPGLAAKMYEENTVSFPKDYRNFLAAGLYYAKQKATLDKSLSLMRKCAAIADSIPAMWLEMGQVYGKLGKDKEELDAYRKFIQLDPENADAVGKIGETLMSKKKTNDAMVFLEMANTLKPNNPKFMVLLAQGYLSTDRSNDALELLEKAEKLKPDDESIKVTLFDLYKATGQSKKALDEMTQIVQKKRDNKTLLKYAEALYLAGVYNTAESTIKDITATEPENIPALMLYGKIQSVQGKWDDALETYKEISYINPNFAPALYERAEVYLMQSKLQWARTFYERTLKADASFALAELGLAKLSKTSKNWDEYNAHLEKAKKLDPSSKAIQEEYQNKKKK